MKKLLTAIFLILSICLLAGCQKRHYKTTGTTFLLDTIVDVTVYGTENEDKLMETVSAAFKRGTELENMMSATDPNSELSYVNNNAADAPVTVSYELFDVIKKSIEFAKSSDGAFDPTLGILIDKWGIGTEHEGVPSDEEIQPLTNLHSYENIVLNEEDRTVYFTSDDFKLNLGAIAKGYIGDEMAKVIREDAEIESALLFLGGNVITIGNNSERDRDWNIGIADPTEPDAHIVTIGVADKCVVTSGAYQRYFEKDGKVYHHILDATTGYPSESGLVSTTIICADSADADALSTATYVLGEEKAVELIESIPGVEAIFVKSDLSIITTSGIDHDKLKGLSK